MSFNNFPVFECCSIAADEGQILFNFWISFCCYLFIWFFVRFCILFDYYVFFEKKNPKKTKQGLALKRHRAPLKKSNFVKSQILQVLNFSVSKHFNKSLVKRTKLSRDNSKQFQCLYSRGSDRNAPPLKGRRTKRRLEWHKHGTRRNAIKLCGSKVVAVSYLVHYLLQNGTDVITKCDNYLLQHETKDCYKMCQAFNYKRRHFHYKLRKLL